MAIIDEVKKYKYIGMPFEAFGFPGPVYSHLVGSNDGLNWADLKKYDFGWRDVDLHYLNGKYYALSGQGINITTDFENFTNVGFNSGLANCWASELFQDKDGQWWIIWCGGGNVDYSLFTIYANKFDPTNNTFGSRNEIRFSDDHGRIDPNVHYINGKYYLWVSITNRPQKLQLYVSDSLLGTYDPVKTNINQIRQKAGFGWNEAPEMLTDNGTYYLYSDPWNNGENEHDRDLYRTSSTDLINWSSMEHCNCDFGMRHFTPFLQGGVSKIKYWDGNAGTLEVINQTNFQTIQNMIDTINNASHTPRYPNINFDVSILSKSNRGARNQFINNAQLLSQVMPNIFNDYRYKTGCLDDINRKYEEPVIPMNLITNKADYNNFWSAVANNLAAAFKVLNK